MTDSLPAAPAQTPPDSVFRPQDDFYRYVNGQWLATHDIPADRPVDGAFHALRDASEERCRAICEDAASGAVDDPDAQRIGAIYSRFMDEASVEAQGVAPLSPEMDAITGAATHSDLAEVAGMLQRGGVGALVAAWVGTDPHDSAATMLTLSQSGIGLPDEAYYREDTHQDTREAYRDLLRRYSELLAPDFPALVGDPSARAQRIVELETAFASHHRDAVSNRDPLAHDNPRRWADLASEFPGYDWQAWARGLGLDIDANTRVNIAQPEFLGGACQKWAQTDLETLKEWLVASLIDTRAPLLSQVFQDTHFDFHGRVLSGTEELRPRWKRALSLVEGTVGEALGRVWTARHFPPESKALMDDLVAALLEAYRVSIRNLEWMSEGTKEKALAKLSAFTPKIGHPEQWKSYDALDISSCPDLVSLVRAANAVETDRELAKLGKPVDRQEWFMFPHTVNAYYNPTMNEIVFPAAILQPPFFDPNADAAENFGAIGAVIGHEIGHGFDDQGSRWDGDGNLHNWWEDEDRERFEQRTAALIAQYDALVPHDIAADEGGDDLHVNGALTIGENIGDLGGLSIAWAAYCATMDKAGEEITREKQQSFFLSWARVWRTKARLEFAKQMLAIDPHSPAEFRCNQVLANMDAFADAWDLAPSDALWIAPHERVRIWA